MIDTDWKHEKSRYNQMIFFNNLGWFATHMGVIIDRLSSQSARTFWISLSVYTEALAYQLSVNIKRGN